MLPDLLVFDLDDTLLDHKSAETAALEEVHGEFGEFTSIALHDWVAAYRETNARLWTEYAMGRIGRPDLQRRRFEEPMDRLGLLASSQDGGAADGPVVGEAAGRGQRVAEIGTTYMNRYRGHWDWMPGAREAYHALAERVPVGILTNGFLETQRLKCDQFGFWETARTVVISEEVGIMKPDRRIFDHTRGEVPPEKVLYVGDSLNSDIRGGTAAGWRTAWYCPDPSKRVEGHGAELVFGEFGELLAWLGIEGEGV